MCQKSLEDTIEIMVETEQLLLDFQRDTREVGTYFSLEIQLHLNLEVYFRVIIF